MSFASIRVVTTLSACGHPDGAHVFTCRRRAGAPLLAFMIGNVAGRSFSVTRPTACRADAALVRSAVADALIAMLLPPLRMRSPVYVGIDLSCWPGRAARPLVLKCTKPLHAS